MNRQSGLSSADFREENRISAGRRFFYRFHIDLPLWIGIMLLAAMGMGLPARVLVGPQLFAVRCIDLEHGLVRYYQRHYMNIDRGRLDECR